jgi:hypothetical protein
MSTEQADWQRLVELAGLSDDGGGVAVRLRTTSGIWRPTGVRLKEENGQLSLVYELAHEPRPDYYLPIQDWGWAHVEDADGLLDAFIKVRSPDDALQFAQQWGPLFSCSAHEQQVWLQHHLLTREQLYHEGITYGWPRRYQGARPPCMWTPNEPVSVWLNEAARARDVFRAICLVRQEPPQPIPPELWWAIDVNPEEIELLCHVNAERPDSDPHKIENFEQLWTNFHLLDTLHNALHAEVRITEELRLEVDPGLGFIAAVWLLIAQAASRVRALYFCSGCGEPYARPANVRAPKPGQHNFCGMCRQGNKNAASKKLYAARRRRGIPS